MNRYEKEDFLARQSNGDRAWHLLRLICEDPVLGDTTSPLHQQLIAEYNRLVGLCGQENCPNPRATFADRAPHNPNGVRYLDRPWRLCTGHLPAGPLTVQQYA